VEPSLKVSSFKSNHSLFWLFLQWTQFLPFPKLPTQFFTPHSLAGLPSGGAPTGTTATVAGAAGGIARTVFFNLFPLLFILRSSPGKCHKVQGGRHTDSIGQKEQRWIRKKSKFSII
jgi:hypothetical protein